MGETVRLHELNEVEFRDVARRLRPAMTDEQFSAAWAKFQELKRRKLMS